MQDLTETNTAPPAGFMYGSFSRRSLAFSVDQMILLALVVIFTIPAMILLGMAAMVAWPFFVVFIPTFCSVRIPAGWLYFALQESSKYQGTFGKRLCNLRVTDMQGNRISFPRASVRYFVKYVSAAIMMIGFIMAAFTEQHQALHDLIAETLVLRKIRTGK